MQSVRNDQKTTELKGFESLVEGALDFYFVDLPKEPAKFSSEIARIRQALKGNLPPDDQDYSQLQKCMQKPNEMLPGLEGQSRKSDEKDSKTPTLKFTLLDVRRYIIDFATKKLTEAAALAKHETFVSEWNAQDLYDSLPKDDTNFQTVKPRAPENPHLYPLRLPPGKIYSGWIDQDIESDYVQLNLEVEFKKGVKKTVKVPLCNLPDSSDDEEEYLEGAAARAKPKANDEAAEMVIDALVDEKIILEKNKKVEGPGKLLLTYKPYLNLIRQRKIPVQSLPNLKTKQVTRLTNEHIQKLIDQQKIKFNKARHFTNTQFKIMKNPALAKFVTDLKFTMESLSGLTVKQEEVLSNHFYWSMVNKGEIKLRKIKQLTDEQCDNLLHPHAVNLQKKLHTEDTNQNHELFFQLANMTKGAKKLLCDANYFDWLMNGKFSFESIVLINMKKTKILLKKYFIPLLSKGIITFKTAFSESNDQLKLLLFKNINERLLTAEITVNDVFKLGRKGVCLFIYDPLIRHLYQEKLLSFNDIDKIFINFDEKYPNSNFAPSMHAPQEKKLFRSVFAEFMALTEAGFLTDCDLHFFHSEFFKIMPKIQVVKMRQHDFKIADQKESESLDNTGILSKIPEIQNLFETNIIQRIYSILFQNPLFLPTGEQDSLELLVSQAKQFGIKLYEIAEGPIHCLIKKHFYGEALPKLKQILIASKILELPPTETHARIFANRMMACFEKRPFLIENRTDSIERIHANITRESTRDRLVPEKILQATMRFFLLEMKETLLKELDLKSPDTFLIYQEIYRSICRTELEALDKPETERSALFSKTFNEINLHIKASLETLSTRSNQNEVRHGCAKRMRFSYTLWRRSNSLNSMAGVKEFCDKFTKFKDALQPEEPQPEPQHQPLLALLSNHKRKG